MANPTLQNDSPVLRGTIKRHYSFEPYCSDTCTAPVTRVTPDDGFYVFTYFDVCPFSPSQRLLATTRLPYQDRMPVLGDIADVCVIDLEEETIETVYTTQCWGFQTGALLNWGSTDRHLYTNDFVDGEAVCVRIDLESGQTTTYSGPMYTIAPDESCVVGFPLELMDITQLGYGAPSKNPDQPQKLPPGASKNEGIWRTDLKTNQRSLIVSLADLASRLPDPAPREDGTFYFWHSKFNQQGTRIMQVLRCVFPDGWGKRNPSTFTFNPDGSDIQYLPFTSPWGAKGGHSNWHPDGEHLIRIVLDENKDGRYCQIRSNGTERKILGESLIGGGHASIDPTGRYIFTDEKIDKGHTIVLRLADLVEQKHMNIAILPTIEKKPEKDPFLRLDGHPVWSRDYRKVCFQAAFESARQLFIADLSDYVGQPNG